MLLRIPAFVQRRGSTGPVITRRQFNRLAAGVGAGLVAAGAGTAWASPKRYQPIRKGDGHYTQPWFLDSFLEFKDDLDAAREKSKRFAVIWELEGCPYCREMHFVNFTIPEISDYIKANFDIVQLDIKGAREVTDFDGKVMPEKKLAKLYDVSYTPTIQFFAETTDGFEKPGGRKKIEVARIPGYLRPFHFLAMFQYVREKAYETTDYRSYLQAKFNAQIKGGKEVPSW